jgi:hypothetical protein
MTNIIYNKNNNKCYQKFLEQKINLIARAWKLNVD